IQTKTTPTIEDKKIKISFPTTLKVTAIKPYTEVEYNYYRPDQQLKFNQGTYKAVRIIGNSDLIRAITIGSRLKKGQEVSNSGAKFARDIAKKLGFTSDNGEGSAIMLNSAIRELAKQNRTNTHEV